MTLHNPRVGDTHRGLYLGFLKCFHADLSKPPDKPGGVAGHGTMDVELAISRDTISWQRVAANTPFLPVGPPGAFDSRMIGGGVVMAEQGDKLHFCYEGFDLDHGELGVRGQAGHM
jgi:hypothetical protein